MPRFIPDATLDSMLTFIAENGTTVHLIDGYQVTFAAVNSAARGFYQVETGLGNGGYSIGDSGGAGGGRVLTVSGTDNAGVTSTGTIDHIAITDGLSTLYYVTEVDSQAIESGTEVIVDPFTIIIEDPTE